MADNAEFKDDLRISDEETLFRTVHLNHITGAGGKPGPGAFISKLRSQNVHPSVDRSKLSTPEQSLARKPKHIAVAELEAGTVREYTVGVVWYPIAGNEAHAMILRNLSISDSQWKRVAYKLARACEWAIPPPGAPQ